MIQELLTTLLLSCSIATPKLQPRKLNNNEKFYGTYNLRDELDISYFDGYEQVDPITLQFDNSYNEAPENRNYTNPVYYDGQIYYLYKFNGDYSISGQAMSYDFYLYNDQETNYTLIVSDYLWVEEGTSTALQDLPMELREMIIYMRSTLSLQDLNYAYINALLTKEDNEYVTSYTGYYTFNPNINTIDSKVALMGSITIGTKMSYYMYATQGTNNVYNAFAFSVFNPNTLKYNINNIMLPMSTSGYSNSWYLTGTKMSNRVQTLLTSYGAFAYVPQVTPGEYSFSDLFFDLADTPIYFIYSMFNWELFGANLFLAFTGLMSIGLVLVLFRKFM